MSSTSIPHSLVAPPHTRGWTRRGQQPNRDGDGSPAHAGMDLILPSLYSASVWLPRTRGDGPLTAYTITVATEAPPHTRGWTGGRRAWCARGAGSPAHAGMDPARTSSGTKMQRLPRTRGDGPTLQAQLELLLGAPPHTRGWTLSRVSWFHSSLGSPAHAGMDPRSLPRRSGTARLPRTRGDGPHGGERLEDVPKAPPHTRGWTRLQRRQALGRAGSPAHAGMDLTPMTVSPVMTWLPRTRGDGP